VSRKARVVVSYATAAVLVLLFASGCAQARTARSSSTRPRPATAEAQVAAAESTAGRPLGTYEISPHSGPRGTVVTIRGTKCDQSQVELSFYGPRGDPAAAGTTVAVAPGGDWHGQLVVPENAGQGHDYGIAADCVSNHPFVLREYPPQTPFHVLDANERIPATT
jgi:hypothetical protein